MLVAVTLAMRGLQRPETAARLGQFFGQSQAVPAPTGARRSDAGASESRSGEARIGTTLVSDSPQEDDEPFAAIQDNAAFLPSEQTAWFSLWERVRAGDGAEPPLEATYAQLVAQPETYRARRVRVQGRIVRSALKQAPANDLGVASYHQLWIAPAGGGDRPIVAYALDLPSVPDEARKNRRTAAVVGYFFKVWSYPFEQTSELAPVIVAESVTWVSEKPSTVGETPEGVARDNGVDGGRRQNPEAVRTPLPPLSDVLAAAGVDLAPAASLRPEVPLTAAQTEMLQGTFFRLQEVERGLLRVAPAESLDDSASSLKPGDFVEFEGQAVAVQEFPSNQDERPSDESPRPIAILCRAGQATETNPLAEPLLVVVPAAPAAWSTRPPDEEHPEPIRLSGLAVASDQGAVILSARMRWFPDRSSLPGVLWLAARGVDAGLWDHVRQGRSFDRSGETREVEAFYAVLSAVSRAKSMELIAEARSQAAREADAWRVRSQEEADAARATDRVRYDQAIAQHVAERAAAGCSSLWPLAFEPARHLGEAVLFEGVARRCVAISPEVRAFGDLAAPTVYYELDLFTPDGQNKPVIVCTEQLPEGMPTGDEIREPVRLAGVFFKKWAYQSRSNREGDLANLPPRLAPPLVIAGWVERLPAARPASLPPAVQVALGFVAVAGIAALAFVLLRTARRDRLAQERLRRYDGPIDAPVLNE
jgi:hypothetical protein